MFTDSRFNLVAAARVSAGAGAAAFVWQNGAFTTVTNAVVGTFVLTLGADYALDDTQMVPFIQQDGAAAADTVTSFGIVSGTDVQKTVTCVRSDAAIPFPLTDVAFWIMLWKRSI